ncbi:MAG: cytochrome c oxidase accessory protein CcoG [Alphaproteobacteria bacterium]
MIDETIVERVDVAAVNAAPRRSLYAKRQKIFPKLAHGRFRKLKWAVMAATLAIYYVAPWLRWDRPGDAPDQAILIDFPSRKFYFFFIEIWPQEVYYITGLLIIAAMSLFLVNSLFGRVWCGYTCPQTVWTDLFVAVERLVEGDRGARIRLDNAPYTAGKLGKRVIKHAVWIVIAMATGGAWVFYFADAPTLLVDLVTGQASTVAYISVAVLTFTTYMLGGLAREQVCTYMCPWPRIQASMVDEHSLQVTYRGYRGEPRAPFRKGQDWDARGHCIDCKNCVAVCPAGIDIRDGPQLECINCALCIDACDEVMDKIDLPRGLIAYDSDENMIARAAGKPARFPWLRARTAIYAAVVVITMIVMLVALSGRSVLELTAQHDRAPLFVELSDGSIRNGYTVKILNKVHEERTFALSVAGIEGAKVDVAGLTGETADIIIVGPDSLRSLRVLVAAPRDQTGDIDFVVRDLADGTEARHDSQFVGPKR